MSSRKRKKRSRVDETSEAAVEGQSAQSADDESAEDAGDEEAAVEQTAVEDAEPQPAVSEISELKPRRKRKRDATQAEYDGAEAEAPEADGSDVAEEDEEEQGFADDSAKEAPKTRAQLKRVIESLIFVSDQVITAQQLGRISKTKVADVREVLAELSVDYEGRGIDLVEVNGGYQFRSAAVSAPYVRVLVAQKPVRLTRAQLETLALIAYRQPITRPEVDDVRGVDSGSAIKVLLDRELIKILGRKEDAGRPLLYGTTPYFLEFFGMNSMQELPTLREFTELSDEHRELFRAKTNDIGDPSAEAELPLSAASDEGAEPEPVSEVDDEAAAAEVWDVEPGIESEASAAGGEVDASEDLEGGEGEAVASAADDVVVDEPAEHEPGPHGEGESGERAPWDELEPDADA